MDAHAFHAPTGDDRTQTRPIAAVSEVSLMSRPLNRRMRFPQEWPRVWMKFKRLQHWHDSVNEQLPPYLGLARERADVFGSRVACARASFA